MYYLAVMIYVYAVFLETVSTNDKWYSYYLNIIKIGTLISFEFDN